MDFNEQLRLLQAAQGDPQKLALATLDILLAPQPPELRRAFEAAALPHWFDERLLAALLDEDLRADSQRWFKAVVALPAVEPFPARQGYNVHEATRLALRRRLFAGNRPRFLELAARAVAVFNGGAVHEEIERVYHLVAAEPGKAGPVLRALDLRLRGRTEESLALTRAFDEYAEGSVWPAQARGWAFLLSARNRANYRTLSDTAAAGAAALRAFTEAQDEWACGLSHQMIGDCAVTAGRLAEARRHFDEFHRITRKLAAADPSNAGWQRDLSVSQDKLGDVLCAQGDLAGALAAYRESLAISQRLAAADPSNAGWQRDLSVSQGRLGGVLRAQGDLAGALAAYREAQTVWQRLAAADPSNAGWQHDLGISHEQIGTVLRAQGDLVGAFAAFQKKREIVSRLAAADPSNAGWQRDLSVSQDNLGDMLSIQGDLTGALAAYREALAVWQRLAAADPSNAGWQRDLSVSQGKLGDVLRDQGDLAGALAAYRESAKSTKQKVTFSFVAPEAQAVMVAGDFGGWEAKPVSLKKQKGGVWKKAVSLEPGRYEYRFLVDGQWQDDPNCVTRVPNAFGSENCVCVVSAAPAA